MNLVVVWFDAAEGNDFREIVTLEFDEATVRVDLNDRKGTKCWFTEFILTVRRFDQEENLIADGIIVNKSRTVFLIVTTKAGCMFVT